MKVVLISDTHNRHKHLSTKGLGPILPEGDLLIHAGDFTGTGQKGEVQSFVKWLVEQSKNYTYGIVFIAGNHDRSFDTRFFEEYENYDFWDTETYQKKPSWLYSFISTLKLNTPRITYLENEEVVINGYKIWGSPVTPWFHGDRWAFNKHRGPEISEVWDQIPQDTDIVVTHGPVAYKLDYIPRSQEYVGCEDLRKAMDRVKPMLHVSGHIHESYGIERGQDTLYVNASICNAAYVPENKPIVVELSKEEEPKIIYDGK